MGVKVALVSARFVNRDTAHNQAQIERWMLSARDKGAELVCFGEAFLQGFDAPAWTFETDREIAVPLDAEPIRRLCARSAEWNVDVLFGFLERDGDALYSSCALLSQGRVAHLYRRVTRGWKEYWRTDDHYREGTTVVPFDWRGHKCLIALCGDLWDAPERFALGQKVLFWPVYIDYSEQEWAQGAKSEYAEQAAKVQSRVLMVNAVDENALGGCFDFCCGQVRDELALGYGEGMLVVEL